MRQLLGLVAKLLNRLLELLCLRALRLEQLVRMSGLYAGLSSGHRHTQCIIMTYCSPLVKDCLPGWQVLPFQPPEFQ